MQRRHVVLFSGIAVTSFLAAKHATAQQQQGWHSVVEANASTLFGATSQTLTALAGDVSDNRDHLAADFNVKFRYGEAEDANRVKFVNARGIDIAASADIAPKERFSPFFLGAGQTSLEARIASRVSGGAGAKWTFAKSNTGSASLSLALLGERTAALADTLGRSVETNLRYSWRVKMDQRIDDKLSVSHVTFYAPIASALSRYTITSTTVASYAVRKPLALTLTFSDNYDSQAASRGASENNNGAVLFGVRGTF
jgi:hypothetical protein